jgi:hypothetical protein
MIAIVVHRVFLTWRHARRGEDEELRQLVSVIGALIMVFLAFGMTASLLYQKPMHIVFALGFCVAAVSGSARSLPVDETSE